MEKGRVILVILLISFVNIIFSVEANISATLNYGDILFSLYNELTGKDFLELNANLSYLSDNFEFLVTVAALNNKVYNDPFSSGYYAGFYFVMKDAKIDFQLGNSRISFGKTNLGDIVKTPYSLFISANNYPRNTLEYVYEDKKFIYTTRWIQLSNLQNLSIQNEKFRSANYKVYAAKFSNFRFGYQEINVYVGKDFDFEYFANPIPGFFIQYVNDAGRPFSEGIGEANFIMGFFFDYTESSKYLYGQVLIDDVNMNRFFYPESFQNPDKIAWSFGGSFNLEYGKLSLYHAGATKYTFQPSAEGGNQLYYGYTYFPYLTYNLGSTTMVFPPELLYAGYKYGENNLAFLVEYEPNMIKNLKVSSEYVVLGERSPVNPWGDRVTYLEGTHLLDDPVLEHRLLTSVDFSHEFFDTLRLSLNSTFGYIWNKSELVAVNSDNVKKPLLRPKEGNNVPYFSFSLNLAFKFSF